MRRAEVAVHGRPAGYLEELERGGPCVFTYFRDYDGPPVSVTMPADRRWEFDRFPPFFDGLLPEGFLLESLLRSHKIDRTDCFSQLVVVGEDMVGAVTVREVPAPAP